MANINGAAGTNENQEAETPGSAEAEADSKSQSVKDVIAGPLKVRSWPLVIIASFVLIAAARIGQAVLLPIVTAFLLKLTLSPIVRQAKEFGIPSMLGAAFCVIGLVFGAGSAIYSVSDEALGWADKVPVIIGDLRRELDGMQGSLDKVREATKKVEDIAKGDDTSASALEVKVVKGGSPLASAFSNARIVLFNTLTALILLFFMLAADDALLRKFVRVIPSLKDRKLAVETMRGVESAISSYMLAISLINALLGLSVGIAFAMLGMPNPVLWGLLAGFLNFIPYIGPLIGFAVTGVVAYSALGSLSAAAWPVLAYLVLNSLEGFLVTPLVLGRTFTLSPAVIFVWVMLVGWLWGIPGALVAMPLLAAVKIACDKLPRLQTIGTFLGQ